MKKPSFGTLGTLIVRRRRATLILFLIATLLFGGIGSAVFGKLKDGGYSDPKSDSYRAYDYLVNTLNVKEPTITFVVDAKKNLSDPAVTAQATALEAEIRTYKEVTKTLSYWSTGGAAQMMSKNGQASYIFIYTKTTTSGIPPTSDARTAVSQAIASRLTIPSGS